MSVCEKFRISGRVQGVWYRQSTLERATALGLTGWVRNLPDGRVEVLACGDTAKVESLRDWLWQGPPMASVSDVETLIAEEPAPKNFTIRR